MKNDSPLVSLAAALLLATASAGCVKRSLIVETDPPGAQLWINGRPMGKTPVNYSFVTHGRYKLYLEKAGFKPLTTREMVKAPVYQWIPLDFIFEWLLPFRLEDKHLFQYALTAQPVDQNMELETGPDHQQMLDGLKDPDPLKRRASCVALAARRDPADAAAVKELTGDPDPKVRAAAFSALRSIKGTQATETLLQALRSDPDKEVRWRAASELEALKNPKAVPGLLDALKDPSPLVRVGAAEALKALPDRSAVIPLVVALKEKDAGIRRAAAEALGKIGDKSAVPALTKSLFHHDVQTRRNAARSLALLKDPASGPALARTFTDWDPSVRKVAVDALIDFGDSRVVPLLISRLRGWKPWTREHAAQALGGLKDPRAVKPLQRSLKRESDPPAKEAMKQALAKFSSGA